MSSNYITHKELNAAILEAKNHAKGNTQHHIDNMRDDVAGIKQGVTDCHKRIDGLMLMGIGGLVGFVIALFVVIVS